MYEDEQYCLEQLNQGIKATKYHYSFSAKPTECVIYLSDDMEYLIWKYPNSKQEAS